VDWAQILAAFASEASPCLGSEAQLHPFATRAVQRWRDREKEQKLLLFGDQGKKSPDKIKELFSKRKFQGHVAGAKMTTRNSPMHLDSGYKGLDPMREKPKGAKDARSKDAQEIDVDLGFFGEVDSLGVSLQGLLVESTLPSGRAHGLLMPEDVVTSVNGTEVTSHQEFWREVEHAKPGQLRVCVLPSSKRASLAPRQRRRAQEASVPMEPVDSGAPGGPKAVAAVAAVRPPPVAEVTPTAMIVLNCEDIGSSFFKCAAFRKGDMTGGRFPWEAVRCAIKFYEDLGFMPQPVCHQATMARHPPPTDLREKLVQCPVVDDDGRQQGRGSDRIFVITLAATYDCPFVDNSNYREQVWNGHELWPWLQQEGLALKVEYIFDSFGEFLPSREVPRRASGTIWIPWTEYGGR